MDDDLNGVIGDDDVDDDVVVSMTGFAWFEDRILVVEIELDVDETSITGWFWARWPNFILYVFAPAAMANIWLPRQIPKIGIGFVDCLFVFERVLFFRFLSLRSLLSLKTLRIFLWSGVRMAGSPGPFEIKIPSNLLFLKVEFFLRKS